MDTTIEVQSPTDSQVQKFVKDTVKSLKNREPREVEIQRELSVQGHILKKTNELIEDKQLELYELRARVHEVRKELVVLEHTERQEIQRRLELLDELKSLKQ